MHMSSIPSIKQSNPLELRILTYLQPRMSLTPAQKLMIQNLNKGLSGERRLLTLLEEHLSSNYLILHDLLFKTNETEFQIDILLIGHDKIYPLEVKNYEGDYYLKQNNWYTVSSGNEIRNPLHQLKRSELLLHKFLQHSQFKFPIEPHIVFINPEFHLYHATTDLPIIFPAQITRFIKKLNTTASNHTNSHKELAIYLKERQLEQSTNEHIPIFTYEQLKKGVVCKFCSNFLTPLNYKRFICKHCESLEDLESAVERSIIEFTTLFPNRKITTNSIHEWCQTIESKKAIRRILKKQMNPNGKGKYTYYTF